MSWPRKKLHKFMPLGVKKPGDFYTRNRENRLNFLENMSCRLVFSVKNLWRKHFFLQSGIFLHIINKKSDAADGRR